MVKFFLKKSFFDGWDNFPALFVRNVQYAALGILYFFLVRNSFFSKPFSFYLITLLFLFLYCCLYLGNCGAVYSWTCQTSSKYSKFFSMLKECRAHLFFLFAIILFDILSFTMIIPFYFSIDSGVGYILGVIVFWISFLLLFPLQYFLPLAIIKSEIPINTFKQCIALVFTNKRFTLLLLLKTVFQFVLSIITIALIPGLTGVSISHFDATKLLLLRYEYMKKNKLSSKKDVDYESLFQEEAQKLGKRDLGSIISPWKIK